MIAYIILLFNRLYATQITITIYLIINFVQTQNLSDNIDLPISDFKLFKLTIDKSEFENGIFLLFNFTIL